MAYEGLALIYQGFEDGSEQVKVFAAVEDETVVEIYDEDTLELLGSGEIALSDAVITVSPALNKDQRIIAFLGEFGEKTMGGRTVLEAGERSTGWQLPLTVAVDGETMTVAEYEAATGKKVPAIWNPSRINRVAEASADLVFEAVSEIPVSFNLRIEKDGAQTIVTVQDVEGVPSGHLIKFDSDAPSNTASKIYTADGTYQVQVYDSVATEREKTKTYEVEVVADPPEESEISNSSYKQSSFNYSEILEIIADADSDTELEAKVDGVMGAFADMDFLGGRRWGYTLNFPDPAGTYTIRIRVKSTPVDEVIMTATIY